MIRTIASVSGGLDSTVLAYWLQARGYDPVAMVSFNYGQRHVKELEFARATAERLGCNHNIVDLANITSLISNSALTDPNREVPEGHYAADNMAQTVVPNRNAIMMSIAWGYAVSVGAQFVATAVHAGDHFIYPDCRPDFFSKLGSALQSGNEGFMPNGRISFEAPFIGNSKADIVRIGADLGVPFEETWSCYKGGEIHCGRCGTCVERIEAFILAGVEDPTVYEDREFALKAVA